MIMVFILLVIILLFGLVVFRGAPYVPTLPKQADIALDMLQLQRGQTLLDLGSGDGVMLKKAAKRGLYAVGVELNPILVLVARIRCWRYRRYVTVIWGDYWRKPWPSSDGMYVFILDRYMKKLDKKVVRYSAGKKYKVVSNTFKIPSKKPVKDTKGLYLYLYKG